VSTATGWAKTVEQLAAILETVAGEQLLNRLRRATCFACVGNLAWECEIIIKTAPLANRPCVRVLVHNWSLSFVLPCEPTHEPRCEQPAAGGWHLGNVLIC
jgi:hypothetical protein